MAYREYVQYIPRNMHTVFALLCFVVVIHWLIFPYPSGLLHWHCGNLTIAPVPAKQPWWIWINTSCEFIMNDSITTTKQSTTKPCAYFLGYTKAPIHKDSCRWKNTQLFVMVGVLPCAWKIGLDILCDMTWLCSMSAWNQFSLKSIKRHLIQKKRYDNWSKLLYSRHWFKWI